MTYTPESVERLVGKLWDALMLPDNHLSRYIDRLHSECRGLVIDKDNLRTALASLTEEKECCEWTVNGSYGTAVCCNLSGVYSSQYSKFCFNCGKPIKEVTK